MANAEQKICSVVLTREIKTNNLIGAKEITEIISGFKNDMQNIKIDF